MTGRLKEADERTKRELADKCQENGWLRRGGYPWQDDPYLEEYPYEFAKAGSVEELRGFFAHGNWALRQGIVYEDLAFVQQVDGGDEWWTLKRTDSGWLAFESWSFGRIVQEPERFSHAIECMHRATPEQCKRLEYMEAVPSIEDAARRARDSIQQDVYKRQIPGSRSAPRASRPRARGRPRDRRGAPRCGTSRPSGGRSR